MLIDAQTRHTLNNFLDIPPVSIFLSILELWEYHHLVEHLLTYAISGLNLQNGAI